MIPTCCKGLQYHGHVLIRPSARISLKQPSAERYALKSFPRFFTKLAPRFRPLNTKPTNTNTSHPRLRKSKPLFHSRLAENKSGPIPVVRPSQYPEGYLIYHAGVMRTFIIGVTKVSSALLFAFTVTYLVPGFVTPDQPQWIPYALLVGGTLPLIIVYLSSKPFVQFIHIRLPLGARRSTASLLEWSKKISPSTEFRIMTMNFAGFPSISILAAQHLKDRSTKAGVANLERVFDATAWNQDRPWYQGKKPRLFYIAEPAAKDTQSTVLRNVLKQIKDPSWSHGQITRI